MSRCVSVGHGMVVKNLSIRFDDVRRALHLPDFDPFAAQLKMAPQPRPLRPAEAPGTPKLAGVLVLLYPSPDNGDLHFALMRRTEYKGVHSGQISLPGGKHEAGETFEQTALRETCEELGVCEEIDVIGALTPLYIPPSDFEVHPIVGISAARPVWSPDATEVAEVIEVPLDMLFDDSIKAQEDRIVRADWPPLRVHYYQISGHKVWGATAVMLSEFEQRLRTAIGIEQD